MTVIKEGTLPSWVHKEDLAAALLEWSAKTGYPVGRAKYWQAWQTYAGFAENYYVKAVHLPPIPGGWRLELTSFTPEGRDVALPCKKGTWELNKYVLKMLEEYKQDGLRLEVAPAGYENYGLAWRNLHAIGHPLLLNMLTDFLEELI